jgi:hypothetical protein
MFCSNCGKEIVEGSNFCKNCGAKISNVASVDESQTQNVSTESFDASKFKINDDDIKSLIAQHTSSDETENYYFFGIITASLGQIALLGAFASFTNKNCVFNVTKKGIHIYGLTLLGKPKDYSFIPRSEIQKLSVSNSLLGQRKITIEYKQGGKIKIIANKNPFGVKDQAKNLEAIEKLYG